MKRLLLVAAVWALGLPAVAQPVTYPRASAPVPVADFGQPASVAAWRGLPCQAVTAAGVPGMTFTFPAWQQGANEWPAVYLSHDGGRGYPIADWSHHALLALEARASGDEPADLAVELRDHAGQNGWSTHLTLAPGVGNRFELPLADIASEADLRNIEEVVLYTTRPAREYAVTITELRLLPGRRQPLADFELRYPNYRGLILPDGQRVQVRALLHPEDALFPTDGLALRLTYTTATRRLQTEAAFCKGRATAALPVGGLPLGQAKVTAHLVGPYGVCALSREWDVRKLSTHDAGKLAVYIDSHNRTIVDGKPFFPLGWYGSGSDAQAAEIADSPFNCILDYGTNSKPKERMRGYLDFLHSKGLKLIYCLNDVYPAATYYEGKSWEGVTGNAAIAQAVVAAYRDHPALLAWYLNDELPRSMAPSLEAYYRRVAAGDPAHPCYIVLCSMSELPYLTETTDVMGVDPYPIPTSPVTKVSEWMEAANRATGERMPTWLVPQAFAWYQHHPPGSDRGRIPTEEDLRTGRAPTYEEARCMTYLALAHGAKGLIYWCYYNMRVLPQYQEMWAWMKAIGAEVRDLSPVLLSEAPARPVRATPAGAPIHSRLMHCDGRDVLIAVNAGKEPCRVRLQPQRPMGGKVDVLFEGRRVTAEGECFSDDFAPLAVHVYEFR